MSNWRNSSKSNKNVKIDWQVKKIIRKAALAGRQLVRDMPVTVSLRHETPASKKDYLQMKELWGFLLTDSSDQMHTMDQNMVYRDQKSKQTMGELSNKNKRHC